jgi:iron transport multicopper oxidase
MHPATVASSTFGILWKNTYNSLEKFYAKPLVYTPAAGGSQLVFLASSMNIIRTVNAVTGAPINSRTLNPPFLQSDIGCTDIPNYIGITGTPIIDPSSDTVYFFSKGYQGGAAGGGIALGSRQ